MSETRPVVLNGIDFDARQYIGIGVLRVNTRGGEFHTKSTDWILTAQEDVMVLSNGLFQRLFPVVKEESAVDTEGDAAVVQSVDSAPAVNSSVSTVSSTPIGSTTGPSIPEVTPVSDEIELKRIRDKQSFMETLTPEEEEFLKAHTL